MRTGWEVPQHFIEAMSRDEHTAAWVADLGRSAAATAARWQCHQDGHPATGGMSCVWPVRGRDGALLVLKMTHPGSHRISEAAALTGWGGRSSVTLLAAAPQVGALLLERLDPSRSLQGEPIDEAVHVLAQAMADLHRTTPPDQVPLLEIDVARIAESIERNLRTHPGVVERRCVDAALAGLAEVAQECRTADRRLLHGDLHFLNVLHSLPGELPGWRVIDPLPSAGIPEWDVTAMLRNRMADAVATGDPDAALRRRVDVVAEVTGMSAPLARRAAQAVAVDNLSWLLPREPGHMFVEPYRLLARWGVDS